MELLKEFDADVLSMELKELFVEKRIAATCCAKLMGIRSGTFSDAIRKTRFLSREHCYALCLFMEFTVEEAERFLNIASYSLSNCGTDSIFIKHLRNKDYGLLNFVNDELNLIAIENVKRKENGIPPIKIPKFYFQEDFTNISYSDCLNMFGEFDYNKGKKLLKANPIK